MRNTRAFLLPLLFVVLVVAPQARAGAGEDLPGFVDGSEFLELATEKATTVEVNFDGALLKTILGIDPELKQLAGGLESIHAVILGFEQADQATKALDLLERTEQRLTERKWQALTRIKEGTSRVSVLALSNDEHIEGLVVLVADAEEGEVVFANIAGKIDLAAIARLGETFDIPGLDQIKKD